MRLKQIKLAGFKSFVDPTSVSLPSNLCSVVGPNGCGKSNIIDAVRWVMGESSAKQLRGEAITDVIFNGSRTRKPTALASIELHFDNSDGRIGGEYASYAEIAIRREVSRDAQSTYFLNGSKCRRRDIQDIFLGTGFGPRSYSIIEQGMISQLVEAKPEDLRTYLEEAAGISKYKERRRETENRIRHTRENLDRLNDIREELERQLNRLDRQAKAAEKYRELKAEERTVKAQLLCLSLAALETTLTSEQEAITRFELDLEAARTQQQSIETDIEKARAEHGEASEQFNGVQARFYELGGEIARIEEAIGYAGERVKQLELDLETVSQRREETGAQLAMDDREIERFTRRVAELAPLVATARGEDERLSLSLDDAETASGALAGEWDSFSSGVAGHERAAEVQESRIEHLEQLLQRLRSRLARLDEDPVQLVASDGEDIAELASQIDQNESQLKQAEIELDALGAELASAREDLLLRDRTLEDARAEVADLRHELATLQALQEAALGQGQSVSDDWLANNQLDAASRLGESLSVVSGWERAVEVVLGSSLQALRVTDINSFEASIAGLQGETLALFEGRQSPRGSDDGALPTLASFIRADDIELGGLLDGLYAAQSLSVALAHRSSLAAGESIITRDGVWVGVDWLRVMPADAEDGGIIERAHSIETRIGQVEQAEQQLAEFQGHLSLGRERVRDLEQRRDEIQGKANTSTQALGQLRADHGVRRVRLEEAGARAEREDAERAELNGQIESESGHLSEARRLLSQARVALEGSQAERERLQSARQANDQALSAARTAARTARDAFHAASTEASGLESRLSASRTARQRLVDQQQELNERAGQIKQGIDDSSQPLPELKESLEVKLAGRVAVEQELSDVRGGLEASENKIRASEEGRRKAEAALADIRERLEHRRVERQGLIVQQSNLKEQIVQTGLTEADVRAQMPEEADEAQWQQQLDTLDRRISRLGAINLAAIDEFKTQSERKTYLDQQHEDLVEALETLQNAIRKIDKETRSRFKDTFEAVNGHLKRLFPKVFGGGHAYLELTGEDLLDTGVALMAQPPGKRNASVHLLSGGEKAMTAVALIFSIFQLNPSPVCMLDEVDAPLDDSNVQRFADLIKEMSSTVQFVVITHNKITMEMADYLMGVTMHEPGVSRLVTVDVEEAAAMAAV